MVKAHVVLIGPHGVGKSSLAKTLAASASGQFTYELEQLVTTRQRRPGEDDSEYMFVDQATFDADSPHYLMVQPNRGVDWSYALKQDRPLPDNTLRLYVVVPETAEFLRQKYPEDTVICAILPPSVDVLEQRLRDRDATIAEDELALRLGFIARDITLSQEIADITFYNNDDLQASTVALGELIEQHVMKRSV